MERSDRRDAIAFATLAVGLLAWFAGPGILRGFVFPVGPDAPVYLWWTRLAGVEGLSSVTRPGVPALALVLAGTFGASVSATLAALEIVGGVLIGIGGAALVRIARPDDRATWVLAGALTGTFAVHVATGYLATLVFGVLFIAALSAVGNRTKMGTTAATVLLGAGAIAHPRFLAVGAAIIGLAALLAWRDDRDEARRLLAVVLGGAAILAVAGLALLVGPSPLLADTSRDAFLRRAGLDDILHGAYLSRFKARWTRYAPWGAIPAFGLGIRRPKGAMERLLAAWTAIAVAGALVSLATGVLPVDRFVTFAFSFPMVAAIGIVRLFRCAGVPAPVRRVVAASLGLSMLFGAGAAWSRQRPSLGIADLAALRTVNAVAAAVPDAALVLEVGAQPSAFTLTLAGNALRAAVPSDRISDVVVASRGATGGAEGRAIEALTDLDERTAALVHAGSIQRISIHSLARRDFLERGWVELGPYVAVKPAITPGSPREVIEPYRPWMPIAISPLVIGLLLAIGWPFVTVIMPRGDRVDRFTLASASGITALILVGFAVDRAGIRLASTPASMLVVLSAATIGGVLRRWRRRGIVDEPAPFS